MLPAERDAFDRGRDLTDKAVRSLCYAPFTSMYLDPHGDVLACCHNTGHRLGNVADHSLGEIWHGARADELRHALRDYDLSRGCRFCAWQVEDGNLSATYARSFEGLPVDHERPAWPRRLEFAVSNTCNLECVMCNGDWSSMIRSRREGRPPLPKVYGDRFFEELRPFLAHLHEARFLGGEPFLADETLRIMDLLVDEALAVPCHLTTNGTQWNARVERILERLPVSLAVSLDGVTAATVEAIRVGASHSALMENLARYRAYTLARGTTLDLTFCLMQQNWHEFGDYLRFADDWGCRVYVNTVIQPSFSPFHLPDGAFAEMLAALEGQDAALREQLTLNREVWTTELERLRSWRARGAGGESAVATPGRRPPAYFQPTPLPESLRTAATAVPALDDEDALALVRQGMGDAHAAVLRCDADDVVVRVDPAAPGDAGFVGVSPSACVGRPFAEVVQTLARLHGESVSTVHEEERAGRVLRHVVFRQGRGPATYLQVVSYPEGGEAGGGGSVTAACWSTRAPAWAGPADP